MTFLARMAEASRLRVRAARAKESEAALERRALAQAEAPALVLGAALALEVTGRVPDARAGVQRAISALESGAAADLVAKLIAFGARSRA